MTLSSGDLFIAHDYPTLKNTTVNIRNIFYVNGPGRVMNEFICHFNKIRKEKKSKVSYAWKSVALI